MHVKLGYPFFWAAFSYFAFERSRFYFLQTFSDFIFQISKRIEKSSSLLKIFSKSLLTVESQHCINRVLKIFISSHVLSPVNCNIKTLYLAHFPAIKKMTRFTSRGIELRKIFLNSAGKGCLSYCSKALSIFYKCATHYLWSEYLTYKFLFPRNFTFSLIWLHTRSWIKHRGGSEEKYRSYDADFLMECKLDRSFWFQRLKVGVA